MNNSSIFKNSTPNKKNSSKTFLKTQLTPISSSLRNNSNLKRKKTPVADRFIASREAMDFKATQAIFREAISKETSSFSLSEGSTKNVQNDNENVISPNTVLYRSNLRVALNTFPDAKILSFKQKAPQPSETHINKNSVLYTYNRSQKQSSGQSRINVRRIPKTAEKVLDAPDLLDDYYLNLLSWSSTANLLSVALGNSVYLWNSSNGSITKLMSTSNPENPICSVQWIQEGNVLAIGNEEREVQLWDANELKILRTMTGHSSRVGSLSWNRHIISSGSRSGVINHYDVRARDYIIASSQGHTQEVCGLQWNNEGTQLASGGNDNILNIWDVNQYTSARFCLQEHQAAVKAIAWCPWQRNLLATGGGTSDRTIRFWNSRTGICNNVIDTQSQVCSILWAKHQKELISSHGFSQNQLCIWKYPTMTKIAELTGHTSRVLHIAMSPDGQTVVSAAADETLRFWKCFDEDLSKQNSETKRTVIPLAPKHYPIR